MGNGLFVGDMVGMVNCVDGVFVGEFELGMVGGGKWIVWWIVIGGVRMVGSGDGVGELFCGDFGR